MKVVNKPVVSKYVAWVYGIMVAFISALIVFFVYAGVFTPMGTGGFLAAIGVAIVEALLFSILRSLYSTRYVLEDKELSIKTTKLIGGNKRIPLETIESVEKTLIPSGIKLFGASFHGGYYKIPNLGRAFLAITNYTDGLLIRAKKKNYIITPSTPLDFKHALEQLASQQRPTGMTFP